MRLFLSLMTLVLLVAPVAAQTIECTDLNGAGQVYSSWTIVRAGNTRTVTVESYDSGKKTDEIVIRVSPANVMPYRSPIRDPGTDWEQIMIELSMNPYILFADFEHGLLRYAAYSSFGDPKIYTFDPKVCRSE